MIAGSHGERKEAALYSGRTGTKFILFKYCYLMSS